MEGLQIRRYALDKHGPGCSENDKGEYCLFSDAEKFHNIAQEEMGKRVLLEVERGEMLKLLRGSATQVICVKCHTMCSFDGKVCTVCGGDKMIEPVRILDHKKVEAIIAEAAHADGECGEDCLVCAAERGGE